MCKDLGSAIGGIFDTILGVQKAPPAPVAEVPAAPAPERRTDTGAQVRIGDAGDDIRNRRTSGASSSAKSPLGGLGKSGLNI